MSNLSDLNKLKKNQSVKKCPICKKKSSKIYFPFCSKQCGDDDLRRWIGENYIISDNNFE